MIFPAILNCHTTLGQNVKQKDFNLNHVIHCVMLMLSCVFFFPEEAFVVCQNYSPPEGYVPNMSNPLLDHSYGNTLLYTTC